MPCDTVQLQSVDLVTADADLLKAALKHLNITFTESGKTLNLNTSAGRITLRNGKAEYASYNAAKAQEIVNSIKIAYSQKAIERVAKKYKFKLTQKADNTITLRRY